MNGNLLAARTRINHGAAGGLGFIPFVDSLSPVAHWRMNEKSGGSLVDRIASEIATLHGAPGTSFILGRPGMVLGDVDSAVSFNGGYAQTGAGSKWSLVSTDFSMFVIAKWTYAAFETMLSLRDSTPTNILGLFTINRNSSGQVGFEAWNWNTSKLLTSDKSYNDGKPHPLGITYDYASNTARLFVDGVLKVTQIQSGGNVRPTASTMSANIATNYGSQNFSGDLDEFIVFSRRVPDADMITLSSFADKS